MVQTKRVVLSNAFLLLETGLDLWQAVFLPPRGVAEVYAGRVKVLIVGSGVVGLVAARVLSEAGLTVRVVSQSLGESSRVPDALINPVRGKRGSVAPEAEEALKAIWNFYPRFTSINQGILRPVPKADWPEWKKKLGLSRVPHRWIEEGLYLETAAWLQTAPLLAKLAEGLEIIQASVTRIQGSTVQLDGGEWLEADQVVYAGGASGAHLLELGGRFTAGSVLQVQEYFADARSYGVYAAGHSLGGSYLPHSQTYQPHQTQAFEVDWLMEQGERLLGFKPKQVSSWAGVRYRLDKNYLRRLEGGYALTGFGSAAYFYAPLYALKLLEAITTPANTLRQSNGF